MNWDEIYKTGKDYTPMNEIYLSELLKHIEKIKGEKILNALDLGSGTGDLAVKLGKHKIKTLGLDNSEIALQEARKKAKKNNVEKLTKFIKQDLEQLYQFKTKDKFDIIFNKLTFAFIKNKQVFLKQIYGLLKQNGVFILMTPVLLENINYTDERIKAISVPKKEAENLLEKTFGNWEAYHSDYFGDYGLQITFISTKK